MNSADIRALEEAFYAAWPAAETEMLHDWRLRYTRGISRRANSVFALDWCGQDIETDLNAVEQSYRQKGIKPAFYLPPNGQPAGLEDLLTARGYQAVGHVHVQTLNMEDLPLNMEELPEPSPGDLDIRLSHEATPQWRECYLYGEEGSRDLKGRIEIMSRVTGQRAFLLARKGTDPVGCGMAVLSGGWVLIQGMRTVKPHQGQGVGTALRMGILAWAKGQGVVRAALQVEIGNPAALRLYAKAGFTTAYDYHYRILG